MWIEVSGEIMIKMMMMILKVIMLMMMMMMLVNFMVENINARLKFMWLPVFFCHTKNIITKCAVDSENWMSFTKITTFLGKKLGIK